MTQAARKAGLTALALISLTGWQAAVAEEPTIWLNVEINGSEAAGPKVKINMPISLIEVVINSIDTTEVMQHLKTEKGIDLTNLWRNLRDADVDEFVSIDSGDEQVKIFKEGQNLRVTVKEAGFDEPNVQIRIPFTVMDFLVEGATRNEFRLSQLVEQLRGNLPLVLVEATHEDENVKIWIEER